MGDLPPGATPQSLDTNTEGLVRAEHQTSSFKSPTNNTSFNTQPNSISQGHGRPDIRSPAHAPSPHYAQQEAHSASSLNMGSMVGALPEYNSTELGQSNPQAHQQAQRPPSLSGASTSALVYQLGQSLQMPNHGSGALPQSAYAQGQYQQNYQHNHGPHPNYGGPFHPSQQRMPHPNALQQPYQNFHQQSQYMYYPSPYGHQGQLPQGFQVQAAQAQAMYGRRPSLGSNTSVSMMGQNLDMPQNDGAYGRHMAGAGPADSGPGGSILSGTFGAPGMPRGGPLSSIPRGPPRKPKQSGHALWVGNLPPGTTVVALKDHFSRDATKDIESLFLISKSNCAFVNYRTEASCTAAMHRFHDSRFNGVRLVCRLRRSSAPASGVPTGPSAMTGSQPANPSPPKSPQVDGVNETDDAEASTRPVDQDGKHTSTAKDKYFIVKSLTLQDLESSVSNGIWATQSHNENVLNKAYETSENVYLIFSANKSGEYFGYARMTSPILNDTTSIIDSTPKPEVVDAPDVPKSIPTPATEFAPKGRIIDDSARGTIFWEADLSESELEEADAVKEKEQQHKEEHAQVDGEGSASGVPQSWGKPFKIEWISTHRLPFYRTRGLRNPWNANREVKIARDGTELETSVGERLIQMFHRLGPANNAVPMAAHTAMNMGMNMGAAPGMMHMPGHIGGPNMQMRPY